MKPTYRQVVLAASGIVVAAAAAQLVRTVSARRTKYVAQAMTVTLSRPSVMQALDDPQLLQQALACDHPLVMTASVDGRVVGWVDDEHPERSGRLALIAAPYDRGTELHLAMRARKPLVKDVVRRLKALLETGEIPTGERSA